MHEQRLISVIKAAARLGIGRSMKCQLVTAREVESLKIGKRRLVVDASLDTYIEHVHPEW